MKRLRPVFCFALTHKKIAFAVLIVVGILLVRPFGILGGKSADTHKSEVVALKPLSTTINASGQVEAVNKSTMTFLTVGRVAGVNFEEGDEVKKGQVIAYLDSTEAASGVSKAEAALKSAQSGLDKVLDDIRMNRFTGDSKGETQTQKMTREQAEMVRDAAFQDLTRAKKQAEWTSIIAPFDGIISEMKGIEVGQNIGAASGATVTVISPDKLKFVANVDEIDFYRLNIGQAGKVILDAYPSEVFDGRITKISPSAVKLSTGGSVVLVELELPEDSRIKDNLNGEVDFEVVAKSNALVITRSALHKDNGNPYVYLMVNGKPEKREVVTGEALGSQVEITSGITAGDKIIISDVKK